MLGRKGRHSAAGVGFTQVELLVVIGIIALLAAILLPSVESARRSAKPARVSHEMRSVDNTAGTSLTCGSPNAGSCFQAHASPFCDNASCCGLICSQISPQCCTNFWSANCVSLAQQFCAPPTGACCRPEDCAAGGTCASGFPNCQGRCLCFQKAEGGTTCTSDHLCADLSPCPNGTPSCPAGQVCTVNTCCGGPVCAPLDCPTTSADSSGNEPPPLDPAAGPTMSGGQVQVSGAPGGDCAVTDRQTCVSNGGIYQGDQTACTPTLCQPPLEACCLSTQCRDATPADCRSAGGIPLGQGSACGLNTCQPDEPCSHCGGVPHWGHQCPPGVDQMPTTALVGISTDPGSCQRDTNLILSGPVTIRTTAAMEDSINFPGVSTMPNHPDVIDTEILSMVLTGGGTTLRAGLGMGLGAPLRRSLGAIVERPGNGIPVDSFFDVFFEIEIPGGGFAYNQEPLRVSSEITCLPPDSIYHHLIICEKLFTSPFPGQGVHISNLVSANHGTFPACGDVTTGDCFEPHDTPFCSAEQCCSLVCEFNPACCTDYWNVDCAGLARKICTPVGACCANGTCTHAGTCVDRYDSCDGRLECKCFESAEGDAVCSSNFFCGGHVFCPNGTVDCPAGEVCFVDTCCGQPTCAPPGCSGVATAVDPASGETAAGRAEEVAGIVVGECAILGKTVCEDIGGVFRGDGTTCEAVRCELREACCLPDGRCAVMESAACRNSGGFPQGTPSSCRGDGNGDGIDDACGARPCEECGPGNHWIHNPPCPPGGTGSDTLSSGAYAGIDFTGDCIADTNLVLFGPATIHKRGPSDDSAFFPGLRAVDGHLDVVNTEIVAMSLTGGGVVLTAGGGLGAIPLQPSRGAVAEQPNNPALADSFFDVFFEVDTPQGRLYNLTPIRVETTVTCLPPDGIYAHIGGCTPLSTSPHPGEGQIVAYLTSAKHFTYPGCCLPDGRCIEASGPACDEQNGKPVPECLGDGNGNQIDDACEPKCAPTTDGSACEAVDCQARVDRCVPRCVNFNPFTGQTRVIECDCSNVEECHVQLAPQLDGTAGAASGCIVPDNGSGTVTLPPANCSYVSPDDVHMIINGLPAGTTIQIGIEHREFFCPLNPPPSVCSFVPPNPGVDCDRPGGSLGGEQECSNSILAMNMHGTGALGGFNRQIPLHVSFETHIGLRALGDPVQSFDTDMFRLFGQITGDPDFDLLRIVAGTDFGMPSPGHTLLTRIGGDWAVDSFFDITYRIDFIGKPGGALSGMSGSTTGTIRMQTSPAFTCRGGCDKGEVCDPKRTVNADGTIDICCRCRQELEEACCLPNGTCGLTLPERCREAHGVPLGPGSLCKGDHNGNQIDDACEPAKEPCGECGPGNHWIHSPPCPPGADIMSTGAVVGISINGDCIEDTNLVLFGAASVHRSGPRDDSANFPGLRAVNGHLDVIDTEMLSMSLTGSGFTLIAGAGLGQGGVLRPSLGAIAEQAGNPSLADSFFDVFFEIDRGVGPNRFVYNQIPVRVKSEINCLPPDATYFHLIECLPLYSSPIPGQGILVAYLTSANHSTFPKCGDPGTGSCFVPHDPPFCDNGECCERVCEEIPACCELRWAPICVQRAQQICVQPTVKKWESVVTHTGPPAPIGPVGPVGLEIPADGSFSEPRSAIRKIVVTFDLPIDPATVTPGSVNVCGLKPGAAPGTFVPVDLSGVAISVNTSDGDTKLVINFQPGLPDFARYLISLKGIRGPFGPLKPGTGGLSRILTALQGDAFMDLRVNATDVGGARSLVPTSPINPTNLRHVRSDANNDGRINATDVGGIRSKVGHDARTIPNPVCP